MLYYILFYFEEVDWNGRVLDSYGKCGKAETPQAARGGGSRISPHGKREPCSGNQHHTASFTLKKLIIN
ncbi:hypothetical protein CN601_16170 [Bacillus sp. AFS017336]|nr:hypothetical protein CN601_16170 [Bacillus sp. AFS017336]